MSSATQSIVATATQTSKFPPLRPLTAEEKQIVLDNLGLAKSQAWRIAYAMAMTRNTFEPRPLAMQFYEDLYMAGVSGLCVGVQRYDASAGKMSSYIFWWAKHAIMAAARDECELRFGPVSKGNARRFNVKMFSDKDRESGKLSRDDHTGVFDVWDSREAFDYEPPDIEHLSAELSVLLQLVLEDDRWVKIVKWHVIDGRTMSEMARELNITKQRAQQILANAMRYLRDSKAFQQALEAQYRRREMNASDFDRMSIGVLVA